MTTRARAGVPGPSQTLDERRVLRATISEAGEDGIFFKIVRGNRDGGGRPAASRSPTQGRVEPGGPVWALEGFPSASRLRTSSWSSRYFAE
jgi:hypothetical protein